MASAIKAGIPVFPIPGANAAICALIASGLPTESFTFHGFLHSKQGQRRSKLETLTRGPQTHIFYETPHRILEALADIEAVFTPQQPVALAREITKLHEEFLRGPASQVRTTLAARAQVRGEMVLMLHLPEVTIPEDRPETILDGVKALMASAGLSEMDALKRVARDRNMGKSEAYRELQREQQKKKR